MSRCPLHQILTVGGLAVEPEGPFSCLEYQLQMPPSSCLHPVQSLQPLPPSNGPFGAGLQDCLGVCVRLQTGFRMIWTPRDPRQSSFCRGPQCCSLPLIDASRPPWIHTVRGSPAGPWSGLSCGSLCSCGSSLCVERGPARGFLGTAARLHRWPSQGWAPEPAAEGCKNDQIKFCVAI